MEIINAIIHRLQKEPNQTHEASIELRPNVIDPTSATLANFTIGIHQSYSRRSKPSGIFETDESNYPFQGYMRDYLDGTQNNASFLNFSSLSMERLKIEALKQPMSTGGYAFFLHYKNSPHEFVLVLVLSLKAAFNVQNLNIEDLEVIEIDTLRFAARVDVSRWRAHGTTGDKPHLSFIRGKAVDVSKYFQDFIGCTDLTKPKEATIALVDSARRFLSERDYNSGQRRLVDRQILNYCISQSQENLEVSLDALANLIYPENPSSYIEYVNENDFDLPESFEINRSTLNQKLGRYKYKSTKWELTFDHDIYNRDVKYNPEENTITIRNVPQDFAETIDVE